MKRYTLFLPVLGALGVLLAGCPKPAAPPAQPMRPPVTITDSRPANSQPGGFLNQPTGKTSATGDPLALFGNPDDATESPRNQDHFLMARPQMTLSYNNTLHFPNWVAWHLTASDIGDTERSNFQPDKALPDGFEQITTRDYSGSGFDRGHNCPSKDRTANAEDNQVVFYMTNITPQYHEMNAGPWEGLETYCRKLAQDGNELFILCGHGFDKGNEHVQTIGTDKIAVPDFGWKIVLVLPPKAALDANTRVIAVKMENSKTISGSWDRFITTAAELEQATGLRFFKDLPADVAQALKQKRDSGASSFNSDDSGFRKTKRRSSGGSFGAGGRR